jgi:hypothetical protein
MSEQEERAATKPQPTRKAATFSLFIYLFFIINDGLEPPQDPPKEGMFGYGRAWVGF